MEKRKIAISQKIPNRSFSFFHLSHPFFQQFLSPEVTKIESFFRKKVFTFESHVKKANL